jgi:hypothetical protein
MTTTTTTRTEKENEKEAEVGVNDGYYDEDNVDKNYR